MILWKKNQNGKSKETGVFLRKIINEKNRWLNKCFGQNTQNGKCKGKNKCFGENKKPKIRQWKAHFMTKSAKKKVV